MAAAVGLHLVLHERLINSRPTLQAAEFAREQGRFDAMHHELLKAYWDKGRDVSDMSVLHDVAAHAGVDVAGMEAAVKENRFGDYLDARRSEAEDLAINGIPAHVPPLHRLQIGLGPALI